MRKLTALTVIAFFVTLFTAFAIAPASAQKRQDWERCKGDDIQLKVFGCTKLIERGRRESALTRALAYMNRGFAYLLQGDVDRSIADANEAIRLHPVVAAAGYSVRGSAHMKRGDIELAIADFSDAVRLDPQNLLMLHSRGIAYDAKGDHDAAIKDYTAMLRSDPNSATAYLYRGVSYLKKRDFDFAIRDLNNALRIEPKRISVYVYRGTAYEEKGAIEEARKDFKTALTQPGTDTDPEQLDFARQRLAAMDRASSPLSSAPQGAVSPVQQAVPQPRARLEAGTRVALVMGNGAYMNVTDLPNPPNDARDIAAALRDLGFKVIEGYDLDSTTMRGKIAEFGAVTPGAAVALLFYAGHGVQVAGKNYLVPIDAKLERPSSLGVEAIEVGTILSDMEAEKRVNLVFLDACRDNPLARGLARAFGATRSAAVGQGLAQLNAGIGTLIAFATSPDTVALDGNGRNSPFTTALLKHIRTPGIEVRTMLTRVRADVIKATNDKQVPWDHSSLTGEFYFRLALGD